jgi:hypothetical protein
MSRPPDRRQIVASSSTVNGIDYVEVSTDGTTLTVHFLNEVSLEGVATGVTILRGAVSVMSMIRAVAWSTAGGRPLLTLTVTPPSDTATYTLTLTAPAVAQAPPVSSRRV